MEYPDIIFLNFAAINLMILLVPEQKKMLGILPCQNIHLA